MTPNYFQEFVDRAVTQVRTVVTNTKTAAVIIFVAGVAVGHILF